MRLREPLNEQPRREQRSITLALRERAASGGEFNPGEIKLYAAMAKR